MIEISEVNFFLATRQSSRDRISKSGKLQIIFASDNAGANDEPTGLAAAISGCQFSESLIAGFIDIGNVIDHLENVGPKCGLTDAFKLDPRELPDSSSTRTLSNQREHISIIGHPVAFPAQ